MAYNSTGKDTEIPSATLVFTSFRAASVGRMSSAIRESVLIIITGRNYND
jgi:hypothetical protein